MAADSIRDASKAKEGIVAKLPWVESVRSLGLLVVMLAFVPSWKTISGADTIVGVLVPAVVDVLVMCVWLTVQMVRLPVRWCDYQRNVMAMRGGGNGDGDGLFF